MSKPIRNTLRSRLAGLEQSQQQRRQPPVVAFYHADVEGDAEASAERFERLYGRPPVVLLPFNGREKL